MTAAAQISPSLGSDKPTSTSSVKVNRVAGASSAIAMVVGEKVSMSAGDAARGWGGQFPALMEKTVVLDLEDGEEEELYFHLYPPLSFYKHYSS